MLEQVPNLVQWLKDNVNEGEGVPGADWLGIGLGNDNCGWNIYSWRALAEHQQLVDWYANR